MQREGGDEFNSFKQLSLSFKNPNNSVLKMHENQGEGIHIIKYAHLIGYHPL